MLLRPEPKAKGSNLLLVRTLSRGMMSQLEEIASAKTASQ
jgi:hypothetical protein